MALPVFPYICVAHSLLVSRHDDGGSEYKVRGWACEALGGKEEEEKEEEEEEEEKTAQCNIQHSVSWLKFGGAWENLAAAIHNNSFCSPQIFSQMSLLQNNLYLALAMTVHCFTFH